MSSSKMPISLLRNKKTIDYLEGLSGILRQDDALEKKISNWASGSGSNRLDLNEEESETLEQWSRAAYDKVKQKESLDSAEKSFFSQHEFFFKS